ncbi:MAG TPA: Si-specific NAD(P)(+) transhydrogenase [Terracidiphilus sp.]|jgi:NAD(P) transhydrogenase
MTNQHYDLIVIGSGPAGQKGAINAAKLGKRVAVVERDGMMGGVSVHSGTIPSKTLREAVLYLTGFSERTFYGRDYRLRNRISMEELASRVQMIVRRETQLVRSQFNRNRIAELDGTARFLDANTLEITNGRERTTIRGDHVLIACGTRPARNPLIPFDGKRIVDTDQISVLSDLPREIIIVGGGIIGLEYASMFAALDIRVTVVEQHPQILDFVDREIVEALSYRLRDLEVVFRLGEKVVAVEIEAGRNRVVAKLESGKAVHGDALLYSVGRQGNTDNLNLSAAGLEADERGRLKVNEFFQTVSPHIYAAGDVIGLPALASTSMEQGRLAAAHMFGAPFVHEASLLPYGIYTIPEIATVGQTEEQLTAAKIPYETGLARYEELAKAQMLGDETGLLKLLFHSKTFMLLGVHAIGQRATEIIHIGQTVIAFGGTMQYLRDTVFNYPTLAEAYKVAALNGLNKV